MYLSHLLEVYDTKAILGILRHLLKVYDTKAMLGIWLCANYFEASSTSKPSTSG